MAQYLEAMLRMYVPGIAGFILFGFLLVLGLGQNKDWARKGVPIFALLGLAQLIQVNYQANPTAPRGFFTYRPPVLSRFSDRPGSYRVDAQPRTAAPTTDTHDSQGFVNFDSIPEVAGLAAIARGDFQQKLMLGTGSMLEGVEESLNLDIERSLPPFLYDEWIYMLKQAPDTLHQDCLLGRSNVKYIVRSRRRDSSGSRILCEVFNGSPKPSYLYEDLYFAPRAYVAGTSIFATSPLETLRRMASPDFDALGNVILATDSGASPCVHGSGPAGRVEVTDHQPNRVTLRADLSRSGYVVLLDRFDSNWHARIDEREVPVLRANQLFRAVYAEPGQHVILFYYRQQGLLVGMLISGITIVVLLWIYLRNPDFYYFWRT
jgi:hypothetical protein